MCVVGKYFQNLALKVLQMSSCTPWCVKTLSHCIKMAFWRLHLQVAAQGHSLSHVTKRPRLKVLINPKPKSIFEPWEQIQLVSRTASPEPELLPCASHPIDLLPGPVSPVEKQSWQFVTAHSQLGRGVEDLVTPLNSLTFFLFTLPI